MSLPTFYFLLALAVIIPATLPSSLTYLLIVAILSFIGWAGLARIVRGLVLSEREREYVLAAGRWAPRAPGFSSATSSPRRSITPSSRRRSRSPATSWARAPCPPWSGDQGPGFLLGTSSRRGAERGIPPQVPVASHPGAPYLPHRDGFQLPGRRSPRSHGSEEAGKGLKRGKREGEAGKKKNIEESNTYTNSPLTHRLIGC